MRRRILRRWTNVTGAQAPFGASAPFDLTVSSPSAPLLTVLSGRIEYTFSSMSLDKCNMRHLLTDWLVGPQSGEVSS
jgi:hypothetical protein